MKATDIKHFLKGIIHLDTLNLEKKLLASPKLNLFDDCIFIDLSQCKFAELGALTKLLLIVEGFLKNNHSIFFALPSIINSNKIKVSDNIKNEELKVGLLKKRQNANNFLKKCGFVRALQYIAKKYQKDIYITEEYEFQKDGINFESFHSSFSIVFNEYVINEEGYRFLLPFRWIDCRKGLDEIKEFESQLNKILENEERGLDSIDVKSIKNVVLSELIKNVKEHSESQYAVFTIGLINSSYLINNLDIKKDEYLESSYIKWVKENKVSSQVEIYFGDSGIGILNESFKQYTQSLQPSRENAKDQLESAFEKWTSLKGEEQRRGTKGLYRLRRIVNKYQGIIHIETLGSDGGYFQNTYLYRKTKYHFKGTIINVKLNPYREVKTIRHSSVNSLSERNWISNKYEVSENLSCLDEIKRDIKSNNNLLAILDISKIDLSRNNLKLEELFYEISFYSHPSAVVIYLINPNGKIENETIEILVDSVQTRILKNQGNTVFPEIKDENFEEIHDPVLVIAGNNQTFWYGGCYDLISILNKTYNENGNIFKLDQLSISKDISLESKEQIILYLQNDNSLINLNSNDEIIFNFNGIEKHYEQKFKHAQEKHYSEKKDICTPKLYIVDKWIDVPKILERDEYGFALCLYLKYRQFKEQGKNDIANIDKKNTFMLIDHNQQYELAKKFCELLGIKAKNIRNIDSDIDAKIPKRTKLFPKKSSVIFLTTIISSSETVRRLVKYAKRDFSVPEIILCIGNFRKYSIDKLETWNESTQILSCFQKQYSDILKEKKEFSYFESKYRILNTISTIINPNLTPETKTQLSQVIQIEENLTSFLKQYKLLHYNHYGFYNKRHFTFFLNKAGILNTKSFIWNRIADAFEQWIKKNNIEYYTIYTKKEILGDNSIFLNFLNRISKNDVHIIDSIDEKINAKNVIYFDFGILTGESINQIISQCYGVDKLFVCLLFDQSINSNVNILSKIGNIKYKDEFSQKTLYTNFHIDYLFRLPLNFYTSENCPICEHRKALDYYKIDHEYLFKFSEDRQERLKQNFIDDIHEINYPVDFYYSIEEKHQELSTDIIFQMYDYKILMENARNLTTYRIKLYNKIFLLYKNLDSELKNSESEVYSLLYYLSHEINWLQQEPLIFRDFRILISQIALKVATFSIDDLILMFENSNKYEIENHKLVVRYKYAAISVLRSTDKLLFCQSIYTITQNSIFENICSNNLLQNTLYHISSLFKNSYNKSEIYYIEISNNLKSVVNELSLSYEQKSAINNIIEENIRVRQKSVSIHEEVNSFKELKDNWGKIYNNSNSMPDHPEPYVEFLSLVLNKYESLFQSMQEGKLDPNDKKTLEDKVKNIHKNFENLTNSIENNIIHYLKYNLSILKASSFYKTNYINYLGVDRYESHKEQFGELIKLIEGDFGEYFKKRELYEKHLKYYRDSFIKKEGLSDFTENSKILQLISDFPSNITSVINEIFTKSNFPKKMILLKSHENLECKTDEDFFVYFPSSTLERHLRLILQNLEKRINKGNELSDVDLKIVISIMDKNMLNCTISYNLTDMCHDDNKMNGSLNGFNDLLQEFNGSLEYGLPYENDKKLFFVKINFLRYE